MVKKYSQVMDVNFAILDQADNFINWTYDQIKPFLKGNILEIGSGKGTYSRRIIKEFINNKIILSDIDKGYIKGLTSQFKKNNVSVFKIDLGSRQDFKKVTIPIDSVFALNVLEHIKDDIQALNNVYNILNPKGIFVILVPAYKFLFNCMDSNIGHYRRYIEKEIIEKVSQTKFKIKKMFYFNFLSIFGWYINGNILKKETLNKSGAGLFNILVPILRFFEKYILKKKIGLSLIVVLEKE